MIDSPHAFDTFSNPVSYMFDDAYRIIYDRYIGTEATLVGTFVATTFNWLETYSDIESWFGSDTLNLGGGEQ